MPLPLLLLLAGLQQPARPDTAVRDTTRLDPVQVTVTRSGLDRSRVPGAVGVLEAADLRRGRVLAGLDEALGQIPGVLISNRYNPSLDQRLVIRGAGSRATFGVRGIKILIDGLPQTLPDGQSQLSNLDLGTVGRVEALLGPSSALYGNAAGGVLAFSTEMPTSPAFVRIRAGSGAFGVSRVSLATGGTSGRLSGMVAGTNYLSDGYRQHSRTLSRQVTLAGNAVLNQHWLAKVRYFLTSSPRAENPGALTAAELAARPDSAVRNNVLRGADKSVTQHQVGVTLTGVDASGGRLEATVFGLTRDLRNPLATTPPGPVRPTAGTYSAIDRVAGGARVLAERPLGWANGRAMLGLDVQAMRDDRINRRSNGGAPTDTLLADQRETVSEVGPFFHLQIEPVGPLLISATGRYDRLSFRARDRFLDDGDQGGRRSMGAVSGSLGVSLTHRGWSGYASVGSAFETPTTTELAAQPGGLAGFNERLDPQRTTTVEAGVRRDGPVGLSLAVYQARVRSAIVRALERDGRAFFENAGRLRYEGLELGLTARPADWVRARLSYTFTASRFQEYRVQNGATIDTLDGNRLPGIPRHSATLGLVAERGRWSAEVEHQFVSSIVADDRNTTTVDGWGNGVTTARVATRFPIRTGSGRVEVAPFVAVHNLFDRSYIGSVNANGFGGRYLEPAPGRWAFLGVELEWRRLTGG